MNNLVQGRSFHKWMLNSFHHFQLSACHPPPYEIFCSEFLHVCFSTSGTQGLHSGLLQRLLLQLSNLFSQLPVLSFQAQASLWAKVWRAKKYKDPTWENRHSISGRIKEKRKGGFFSSSLSMCYCTEFLKPEVSFIHSNIIKYIQLIALTSCQLTRCWPSVVETPAASVPHSLVEVSTSRCGITVLLYKFALSSRMGTTTRRSMKLIIEMNELLLLKNCQNSHHWTLQGHMLDKQAIAKAGYNAAFPFLYISLRDSCTSPLAVDAPLTAARRYSTSASHCSM